MHHRNRSSAGAGKGVWIMKKIIAIALCVMLVMSMMAGCSSKPDYTVEKGKLIMSTNAAFPPYEMTTDDGGFAGIDVEIAQAIADKLGLELVIDDMEFDAVVGAVGKQNVDIAMSGITITTERLGVINFSEPYYTESIVCVVKDANTELDSVGTVVDMLGIICNK